MNSIFILLNIYITMLYIFLICVLILFVAFHMVCFYPTFVQLHDLTSLRDHNWISLAFDSYSVTPNLLINFLLINFLLITIHGMYIHSIST